MCGIAGIVCRRSNVMDVLKRAENVQKHRGPDAQVCTQYGVQNLTIGFSHQRLSVLDLSESGNQPMTFKDQKGMLIHNGEVYNYKEIRSELKSFGYSFKSDTDTEVILTALHHWDLEDALSRFNGMWAFAWLDLEHSQIILSRDRAGKKPLYYYQDGEQFYFASEIKTLLEMTNNKFSLNFQIVGEYLQQALSDTSTETFFRGIKKLPPAHYGVIDLSSETLQLPLKSYWAVDFQERHFHSETESIEYLRELFIDSVRLRLRSDVPIGVLLSGGIDSSSIAAVTQHLLGKGREINMLSAVSTDSRYDESPFIDRVGRHLGLDVHKVVLDFRPEQAMDYLYQVSWFNDEPVGSFANVAHYLLMKQAKELGITVILSGQGADELLCGYKKYLGFYIQHLLRSHQYIKLAKVLSEFMRQSTVVNQFSMQEAKRYLPSVFKPIKYETLGEALRDYKPVSVGMAKGLTVQERQALDVERFSVPVLTHYEDRMSMAWSREIRLPFLDYRIMEMLIPLPVESKLSYGWTKYIFRKAIGQFLPPEIVWRKDKQGFVNPQSEWLKKDLRKEVEKYFDGESLIFKNEMVDRGNLTKKYEAYCQQSSGKGSIWFRDIFNPLALEIWLRKFESYIV
jgi:asparagine synthase (glutamine-hydrolysing)